MSNLYVKQALETKLVEVKPDFPSAFENDGFNPITGEAFQEVNILFARPDNPTFGDNHYRQSGYMQVSLRYPRGVGAADALSHADFLRDSFYRGLSLTVEGVTTRVGETPEIGEGKNIDDRYVINVVIRFFADMFK